MQARGAHAGRRSCCDLPQDTAAVAQPDVIPRAEPLALDTTPPLGYRTAA
jgi:hypothetical protein